MPPEKRSAPSETWPQGVQYIVARPLRSVLKNKGGRSWGATVWAFHVNDGRVKGAASVDGRPGHGRNLLVRAVHRHLSTGIIDSV